MKWFNVILSRPAWHSFPLTFTKLLTSIPVLLFLLIEGYEVVGDILYIMEFTDTRPTIPRGDGDPCHRDIAVNVGLAIFMFSLYIWIEILIIKANTFTFLITIFSTSWLFVEAYAILRVNQTI